MIRLYQRSQVSLDRFGEISRWLLEHFDFTNGAIWWGGAPPGKELITSDRLYSHRVISGNVLISVNRVYDFNDDEVGMLFKLKFL